jgi:hypothetical protein
LPAPARRPVLPSKFVLPFPFTSCAGELRSRGPNIPAFSYSTVYYAERHRLSRRSPIEGGGRRASLQRDAQRLMSLSIPLGRPPKSAGEAETVSRFRKWYSQRADELGKRPLTRRRMAATLSPGRGHASVRAPRAEVFPSHVGRGSPRNEVG